MAGAGFEAPLCLRKDGVRLSFLSLFVPRQTGQAQARDISCGLMKRRTPCLAQGVPRMLGASTLDAPLYIHMFIHMHTHLLEGFALVPELLLCGWRTRAALLLLRTTQPGFAHPGLRPRDLSGKGALPPCSPTGPWQDCHKSPTFLLCLWGCW